MSSTEAVRPNELTIDEEAIRRSLIIDSPEYEFPERLTRVDLILAVTISVICVLAVWAGAKV